MQNGDDRDRTCNLRLAKPALSQLSYIPEPILNLKSEISNTLVGPGRVELPTLRLSGARSNQLSYEPKTEITRGFVKAVVRTQLNLILILFKELCLI